MSRLVIAVAVASIAVIGAGSAATADSGNSAKPYKVTLTALNPAATTVGLASVAGKAQLVDGKKNNKVSLHMRGLAPDTTYLWHVHAGSCAATGAPLPGWTYRTQDAAGNGLLTADESGVANTKGTSATFSADAAKSYSVNVHLSTPTNGLPVATTIACGDLTAIKAAGNSNAAGKGKAKKARPAHAKGPKP